MDIEILDSFTATFFIQILREAKKSQNLFDFARNLGFVKLETVSERDLDRRIWEYLRALERVTSLRFPNLGKLFDTVMGNRKIIEQAEKEWGK
jgi:transcriptional regulator NrdR family protein